MLVCVCVCGGVGGIPAVVSVHSLTWGSHHSVNWCLRRVGESASAKYREHWANLPKGWRAFVGVCLFEEWNVHAWGQQGVCVYPERWWIEKHYRSTVDFTKLVYSSIRIHLEKIEQSLQISFSLTHTPTVCIWQRLLLWVGPDCQQMLGDLSIHSAAF